MYRIGQWLQKVANTLVQKYKMKSTLLKILCDLTSEIRKSTFYSILWDECTDISNKEHFTLSFWCLDDDICVNEDFFGLYQVPDITANTFNLVLAIKTHLSESI